MIPVFCNLSFVYDDNKATRTKTFKSAFNFIKQGLRTKHTDVVLYICDPVNLIKTQSEIQHFIDKVARITAGQRIFFVTDNLVKFPKFDNIADVLRIDWFLLMTYFHVMVKRVCEFSDKWNPFNGKILLLMNKANRINRIGLLYKLINNGLADDLKWSLKGIEENKNHRLDIYLPENKDYYDSCRDYLPNLTKLEVKEFIEKYQRNLDNNIQGSTYWGVPFDKTIFDDILIHIVSESVETGEETIFTSNYPFLNEKTWVSILNNNPFIILGQNKSTRRLEELGFDTFKDFLLIPNYDDPDSDGFLCFRDGRHISEIIDDPMAYFQTLDQITNFPEFYQLFRDDSWPKKITADEISNLPKRIQTEIIEGYFPKDQRDRALKHQATIINIRHFKSIFGEHHSKINEKIKINFNNLINIGKNNIDQILTFIKKNNIKIEIDDFIKGIEPTGHTDIFSLLTFGDLNDYSN